MSSGELTGYLQQRIHNQGPISFHDFMEVALYHPELGYYSSAKPRIGNDGDFYTSSDLDPIFGKLLSEQFLKWSQDFDDFTIVELGAGKGHLARHILTHHKFPYRILERSASMREHQRALLAGFPVEWIDTLPEELNGVIFSNEFFDALPVHRFVGRSGGVKEIFVGENFAEIEREPSIAIDFELKEGQVVDFNSGAREWIRRIAHSIRSGFHLAIDYGYLRPEFFAQPRGTLMCYYRHQAHENPYIHIGDQDLTAHVNFSDLIDEGAAHGVELAGISSQKDFLVGIGILYEMQRLAVAGDAESMQRLLKMKTLIIPNRMGERFKVLVQRKCLPTR